MTRRDARTAVEVASLALGSLAVVFPRVTARLFGFDPDGPAMPLTRAVGARNLAYGVMLLHVDERDLEDAFLISGAVVGSVDTLGTLTAAARGRARWSGALLNTAVSGGLAGVCCWALTQ